MFFQFNQNNSGGHFIVDDLLCHRLFIEADNAEEAIDKAESLGCYWNGVINGMDDVRYGNRWDPNCDEIDYTAECPVSVSSYDEDEAMNIWQLKYGKYTIVKQPQCFSGVGHRVICYGIISCNSMEEYVQLLSDEFGWTIPDARIYYKTGEIKEFFCTSERVRRCEQTNQSEG